MRNATEAANAKVTPEHYRLLAQMGFVPHRDDSGRIWFTERSIYAELVKAGKLKPGSAVQ